MEAGQLGNFSDEKLIELIADSNVLAFAALFERYWDELIDVAYRVLADKDGAQDVVQELFEELWNKRSHLTIEKVSSYLHQSTRYGVFRYIRKKKLVFSQQELADTTIPVNNTEEQIRFDEVSELLEQSVKELPDQCQRVFRLSRFEHMSNKEIAEEMNISVRTVENHMSRALEKLRGKFSGVLGIILLLFYL